MTDTKKPVGLRLTSQLWDSLKQYGLQHKPSAKSKEGFDVTQTIEALLSQALGISTDAPLSPSNDVLNDRLTQMIKEHINEVVDVKLTALQLEIDGLKKPEAIELVK